MCFRLIFKKENCDKKNGLLLKRCGKVNYETKLVQFYTILHIMSWRLITGLQPPNVRTKCIQNRVEGNPYWPSKRPVISCLVGAGVIGIWVINQPPSTFKDEVLKWQEILTISDWTPGISWIVEISSLNPQPGPMSGLGTPATLYSHSTLESWRSPSSTFSSPAR